MGMDDDRVCGGGWPPGEQSTPTYFFKPQGGSMDWSGDTLFQTTGEEAKMKQKEDLVKTKINVFKMHTNTQIKNKSKGINQLIN